jgi:hypothetical protein
MVKNVSDGEVVTEGGDDEGDGSENDEPENNDPGAASGLAQTLPVRVAWKKESDQSGRERIEAQCQCEEQGITTDLRHVGELGCIFSESGDQGNRERSKSQEECSMRS